jgi:hypothetical protein
MSGDEAYATNSMSCAEQADLGRQDRRPERRGRALMAELRTLRARMLMRLPACSLVVLRAVRGLAKIRG